MTEALTVDSTPEDVLARAQHLVRLLRDDTRLSADQIESQVIHSIIGELADAYEGQGRDVLCNGLRGAFLLGSAAEFGRRRAI